LKHTARKMAITTILENVRESMQKTNYISKDDMKWEISVNEINNK